MEGSKLAGANVQNAILNRVVVVNGDGIEGRIRIEDLKAMRNYALAIYETEVLDKLELKKGLTSDTHHQNLISKSLAEYWFAGMNLCAAELREADLSGVDFRQTSLQDAALGSANAGRADFREADLAHIDMRGALVSGALFRNADLHDADLTDARGLLAEQLAATDLTGARIPPDIAAFNSLGNVKEVSSSARVVFTAMLGLCVYSWLQIFGTNDQMLLTDAYSILIPLLQIQVPVSAFFIFLPILLFSLFVWCQFYLQHLWEELAQLPARLPDGRPLYRRVYPWLLNSMVSIHFPILKSDRPLLTHLQVLSSVFLAWWIVPLTMTSLWWRFLHRHQLLTSSLQGALAVLAFFAGGLLQRLAGATLQGVSRRVLTVPRFDQLRQMWKGALIFACSTVFVLGMTYSMIAPPALLLPDHAGSARTLLGVLGAADIRGAEMSIRRGSWNGGSSAEKNQIKGAVLQHHNLRWMKADGTFLEAADLRGSDAKCARFEGADLRWADLRDADFSYSTLTNADLRDADLRGGRFFRARMKGVSLDGADLRGADLRLAEGLTVEQVSKTKWDARTRFPW